MRQLILGTLLNFALIHTANASETCGNLIDDDSDGMADEGCDGMRAGGICWRFCSHWSSRAY